MSMKTISRSLPIPRYTSYPPASCWSSLDVDEHENALQNVKGPISLYFHIPFCDKRCFFCGCFTTPSKNNNQKERYLEYLKKEASLFKKKTKNPIEIVHIHFGGGTPTSLSCQSLDDLVQHLKHEFCFAKNIEMSIEIDPRTISCFEDIKKLQDIGFNRVSFGIQDFDDKVQIAIGRIQPQDQVERVISWAKKINFSSINMDLIYGLPRQTLPSFSKTLDTLITMDPDRIALFSFAYLPELQTHQHKISINDLPSPEEKSQIFIYAKERIEKSGYLSIGMDHFAKSQDSLAQAYIHQTLTRNFQGYDLGLSKTLVGFGISSISAFQEGYFQNTKDITHYETHIDKSQLPIVRGHIFSDNDKVRKWTISRIMCGYSIDKKEFSALFNCDFDRFFEKELYKIHEKIPDQLLINTEHTLATTSAGKLFLQNIATVFSDIQ